MLGRRAEVAAVAAVPRFRVFGKRRGVSDQPVWMQGWIVVSTMKGSRNVAHEWVN